VLDQVNRHLTNFRYHHQVVREFKAQRWRDKLSPVTRMLLGYLADLTDADEVGGTANWLSKDKYRAGKGPYLAAAGDTWKFRHYQLRRLLERHIGRRPWGTELDLVIDRWKMPPEQRLDLEKYLHGNYSLRPAIANITIVDSIYVDMTQVVDIYSRLARRVIQGTATPEETALAGRLMDLHEITGGLY
jgi:hypothetical protein